VGSVMQTQPRGGITSYYAFDSRRSYTSLKTRGCEQVKGGGGSWSRTWGDNIGIVVG